ncbi:MAG: outer membrane beta-barrel protein [Oricola sp.]
MKKLIVTAALALSISGNALAADINSPTYAYDWSGFYAGFQAGGGWGTTELPWEDVAPGLPFTDNDGPIDISGFAGGVHAGYLRQSGAWVFGGEATLDYAPLKGDDGSTGGDLNVFDGRWMLSLIGKAGRAIDRTLVYGLAGAAWVNSSVSDEDIINPDYAPQNYNAFGGVVGVGVGHALTDRLSARLEYRYQFFQESNRQTFNCGGFCYDMAVQPKFSTVQVGLSYKF